MDWFGELNSNKLQVQLDQSGYLAGDLVCGVVYANFCHDLNLSSFDVEIKGKERGHYWVHTGQSSTKATVERIFLKEVISIPTSTSNLPQGQYEARFSFRLPESLPASFAWRDNCSSTLADASIFYTVVAKLQRTCILLRNVKAKQPLVILPPQPNAGDAALLYKYEVLKQMNTCCCFGRGEASVTVDLRKSYSVHDGQIQANAVLLNQSSAQFTKAVVSLVQRVTLRPRSKCHGVLTRDDVIMKEELRLNPPLTDSSQPVQLPRLPALNIPDAPSPAVQGEEVISCYMVVVKLVASTWATTVLEVAAPVHLWSPQEPQPTPGFNQVPRHWLPQVLMDDRMWAFKQKLASRVAVDY